MNADCLNESYHNGCLECLYYDGQARQHLVTLTLMAEQEYQAGRKED